MVLWHVLKFDYCVVPKILLNSLEGLFRMPKIVVFA